MPGVSFDRAVEYYDATRGYPEGVDDQLRAALTAHLGLSSSARLLEPGIGTGRIALPFVRAGYDYVGVDLSRGMMARLRAKPGAGRARLICGDVMHLPLADASFDAAILVHILHLVDDWRQVLREVRRVLRPGARVALCNDANLQGEEPPPPARVGEAWGAILDGLGVDRKTRRADAPRGLDDRFAEFLRELGASVERVTLLEYPRRALSARDVVRSYQERIFSSCWHIPDDVYPEASARLAAWLETECPDPDTPYVERGQVAALIATLP